MLCFIWTMLFWMFHSEKTPAPVTPVQHGYAEIRLSQESEKTFSLGEQNINTYTAEYSWLLTESLIWKCLHFSR